MSCNGKYWKGFATAEARPFLSNPIVAYYYSRLHIVCFTLPSTRMWRCNYKFNFTPSFIAGFQTNCVVMSKHVLSEYLIRMLETFCDFVSTLN